MIFENTIGGIYEYDNYGQTVAYTFPDKACINFDGVRIDISGLHIKCYGGPYEEESIDYFNKAISKIPVNANNLYNLDDYIYDYFLWGKLYPSREDFYKYKLPFEYVNYEEFTLLEKRLNSAGLAYSDDPFKYELISSTCTKITQYNLKEIANKIDSIVNNTHPFPKKISLLYDDYKSVVPSQHTTHIVLCYESKDKCLLEIDNTISIAGFLDKKLKEQVKSEYNVDINTSRESFSASDSRLVTFSEKRRRVEIKLNKPSEEILIDYYKNMQEILLKIGVPVKKMKLKHAVCNQKLTSECVPFSIQNKLALILGFEIESGESALEMAARFRSEHAILTYLLNGQRVIPRCSKQSCLDFNMPYKEEKVWYPNYSQICDCIDQKIAALSQEDIERLYLATELDGVLSLATSFRPFLLDIIRKKADGLYYDTLPNSLKNNEDERINNTMAPGILFHKSTNTFFISKKIINHVNKQFLNELTGVEEESAISFENN